MNSNEIDKGQALGEDLADEVVDVEPFEGEPDFERSESAVDGVQDDEAEEGLFNA